MRARVERLEKILRDGENKRTEFKRFLKEKDLKGDRKTKLQTQLRYISNIEPGIFGIGIEDIRDEKWEVFPLDETQYKTSKRVLKDLCDPLDLVIAEEEKIPVDAGFVGIFKIGTKPLQEVQEELIINIMGRVNAGKSTLIGVLLSGEADDGSGHARAALLIHPQEVRRGQTADLHIEFLGLDEDNERILATSNLDFHHRERVITEAKRLLIFYDAPGHQEYSKTMLRSVLGAQAHYGILLVPARDEVKLIRGEETTSGIVRLDPISREQLILISQQAVPFFLVLNKKDQTTPEDMRFLRSIVKATLKEIGRVPFFVREPSDIDIILRELPHNVVVPIFEVSCVTKEGVDLLFETLTKVPLPQAQAKYDAPAIAYIDKIYRGIRGTNVVLTGSVMEGIFKPGQKVKIFPLPGGRSATGRLNSIEVFKKRVERVKAGEVFGFDVHRVPKDQIRRGQVIVDLDFQLQPVREFRAEIVVTYHSVRIKEGYSPVCQIHTISQAVTLTRIHDKEFLALGDIATVDFRFLSKPEFVRVGDKIILREGNMRGFGTILETGDTGEKYENDRKKVEEGSRK